METKQNEETTTEDNAHTGKVAALLALRESALIALYIGISPEYASRFVKEIMEIGLPEGWDIKRNSSHA